MGSPHGRRGTGDGGRGTGTAPRPTGGAAIALLALALVAGPALASEVGKVLLDEAFEATAVGSRPGPWLYFTDEGNDLTVAEAPVTGGRCLKLSRERGTVWKPMISGGVAGEPESTVRLEFDFYLPALSDDNDPVLYVTLRGDGNLNLVSAALGGPGGVAVPQDRRDDVPLGFPLRAGQWGHLSLTVDPLARKAQGAYDLVVTQGGERGEYPNLAFRPGPNGAYPNALWYSPTFHVGGGSPDKPRLAYVDNVRITVVPPREDN